MANKKPLIPAEDFSQAWTAAGQHLQAKGGSDLVWMRAHLQPPLMEHLSFRLGNQLFFVRIEDAEGIFSTPGSIDDLLTISEACGGHACIMPMQFSFGSWLCAGEGWNLRSATDLSVVNPPDLVTDERIEMTDWELHDFAVQVARNELTKSGETVTAWHSNPKLQPSIWLGGDAGPQWVVLQAVRYPTEAKIPDNIKDIENAYRAKRAKGNFAYVTFAHKDQDVKTPLKEGEKPLPICRGDQVFVSFSGLLDTSN